MLPPDCDVSDDVCCTDLYRVADHLRSNVLTALLDCIPDNCPELTSYVTMSGGDDGVVDSLAVAFVSADITAGSQSNGKLGLLPVVRATFDVRLRESGWPVVNTEGGTVNAPDPDRQHALALHAFAHGERMYRKLLAMHAERNLSPLKSCNASMGSLLPLRPLGGTIGFYVPVVADVRW